MKIYYTPYADQYDDVSDNYLSYENKLFDAFQLKSNHNCNELAEKIAESYFSDHDGWEAVWPLPFTLWYYEDTAETERVFLGTYSVEMEAVPQFNSCRN